MVCLVEFFFPLIVSLSFFPALLLFYFSLARYTWPKSEKVYFDDRWMFVLLAVGLPVGALLIYFEQAAVVGGGGYIIVLIFVAIQELIVLVTVNFPRLRRKGAGRFYGFSLGTSIAAGIALGEYGIVFKDGSSLDIATLFIMLVYTLGVELLGGATGSIIGYSIETGSAARGVAVGVSLQVIFNFIVYPVFLFRPSLLTMLFDLAATAVGIVAYLVAVLSILPREIIPPGGIAPKRMM